MSPMAIAVGSADVNRSKQAAWKVVGVLLEGLTICCFLERGREHGSLTSPDDKMSAPSSIGNVVVVVGDVALTEGCVMVVVDYVEFTKEGCECRVDCGNTATSSSSSGLQLASLFGVVVGGVGGRLTHDLATSSRLQIDRTCVVVVVGVKLYDRWETRPS